MKNQTMTPKEIRMRGHDALTKELGVVGALKFMHQYESGHGDYSKERHKWLDNLCVEDIVKKLDGLAKLE